MSLFGESFTALPAATSGGFDSRLIALMLNRLGYHMVVAVSYGRSGSDESMMEGFHPSESEGRYFLAVVSGT
jgi:hypothetical protein